MATLNDTVVVHYDGLNLGKIYLNDVGQRNGLGGGRSVYTLGQDRYLSYGQDATFTTTGDVLLSIKGGRIGSFMDQSALHVTY